MDYKVKLLTDTVNDIKGCLINTAAGACRLGYKLIYIRDNELYKFSSNYKKFIPEGYATNNNVLKFTKYTFYDYCKDALNFSRRSVDRFINICLAFCEKTELDNVTPEIDKQYESYSTSLLSEMLNLSDIQREKCSPDMGVEDVRNIKKNDNVNIEIEKDAAAPDAEVLPEDETDNENWNDTVSVEDVNVDATPLMKSRTYKKKKYILASDDYDCFVDTVSSFTSSFSTVSGYLNKGYLLRLVLYKPE